MYYRQPFVGEYPITQYYGDTYTSAFHTGIDYACPSNTEILASEEGRVIYSGWMNGGWGNCIIIRHPDVRFTVYAHLNECLVKVKDEVKRGQVIGLSGSTGNSTGPHLHFEARTNGLDYTSHFNPMDLPLHSVDDNLNTERPNEGKETIPEGKCKIVCSSAWVRDWYTLERCYRISNGTEVYVYEKTKEHDGLPFRYIGADRCIAEYDWEGTQILGKVEK